MTIKERGRRESGSKASDSSGGARMEVARPGLSPTVAAANPAAPNASDVDPDGPTPLIDRLRSELWDARERIRDLKAELARKDDLMNRWIEKCDKEKARAEAAEAEVQWWEDHFLTPGEDDLVSRLRMAEARVRELEAGLAKKTELWNIASMQYAKDKIRIGDLLARIRELELRETKCPASDWHHLGPREKEA